METSDELCEEARSLKLLGIFAKNRREWFICEQAANAFGITLVPLYDTLGDCAVRYILEQARKYLISELQCRLTVEKAIHILKRKMVQFTVLPLVSYFISPVKAVLLPQSYSQCVLSSGRAILFLRKRSL